MNEKLNMNSNILIMTQQAYLILISVKTFGQFMSEKSKVKLAKTYLLSQILYVGEHTQVKNQIHALIMKICRWTKSSYCFEQSVGIIRKSIKIETP